MNEETMPRNAEIPKDLAAALAKHQEAKAVFDALSISHQAEYVRWIGSAKKADTRQRRIARTVEMLKEERHEP